jgi:hypothetical protein
MADIIPFKRNEKHPDETDVEFRKRCRHQWEVILESELGLQEQDDVTHHRCRLCGAIKTVFH